MTPPPFSDLALGRNKERAPGIGRRFFLSLNQKEAIGSNRFVMFEQTL